MDRTDWTKPKEERSLLDLSNNICHDHILDFKLVNYPDSYEVYKLLADHYNVNIKNLALGYGSSELILRIFQQYKDYTFGIVVPTWQLAEIYARNLGIDVKLFNSIEEADTDIVYIANPNGVTGQVANIVADRFKLVIVDEAYSEFSKEPCSLLQESTTASNIVVVKTMSKTLSVPGIRLGFCVANEQLINELQLTRPGYVTTGHTYPILKLLMPGIEGHVARMKETRAYIESKYDVVPSHGNFVLFKTKPNLPVLFKETEQGLFRMSLTDLNTFKRLENGY